MLASGALGFLVAVVLLGSVAYLPIRSPSPAITATSSEAASASPAIMVGAGDIASCESRADSLTEELVAGTPGIVFTLGDNAPVGRRHDYQTCYAETWGAERKRTRPVVGDEDYITDHAKAYFEYFGERAGAQGYYSFDVASWHVIVLNTECSEVGGCGPDSPQGRWLAADLAAHPTECSLAMFHLPLVSAAGTPDTASVRPLWDALYAAGTELVLNGHFHAYQRFARMSPDLQPDPDFGIRQIIAGTGGNQPMLIKRRATQVEVQDRVFGVLLLRLYPGRYEWEFVAVRGDQFTDSGSETCHGRPGE